MLDINKDIEGVLLKQFDAFVLNKGLTREYHDNQYGVTYLGSGFTLDVELDHFETEETEYYLNKILINPDPFQLMDILYVVNATFNFDDFLHPIDVYFNNRKRINEFLFYINICENFDKHVSEMFIKWAKVRLDVIDFMKPFKIQKTNDDFVLSLDGEFDMTFGDDIIFMMNFWTGNIKMHCCYSQISIDVQNTPNLEELITNELNYIEDGYKIKD